MSETQNGGSPAPLKWQDIAWCGGLVALFCLVWYSEMSNPGQGSNPAKLGTNISKFLFGDVTTPSAAKPNGRISLEEEMANRAEYEGRQADAEKHRQRANEERAYQEWKKRNGK